MHIDVLVFIYIFIASTYTFNAKKRVIEQFKQHHTFYHRLLKFFCLLALRFMLFAVYFYTHQECHNLMEIQVARFHSSSTYFVGLVSLFKNTHLSSLLIASSILIVDGKLAHGKKREILCK